MNLLSLEPCHRASRFCQAIFVVGSLLHLLGSSIKRPVIIQDSFRLVDLLIGFSIVWRPGEIAHPIA